MAHPIVDQLQREIDELTVQIGQRTQLRASLQRSLDDAKRLYGQTPKSQRQNHTVNGKRHGRGPKETILAIVKAKPGLTVDKLLDLAESKASSSASNKRRTLMETLRTLRNDTKQIVRKDGKHYLAAGQKTEG